MTKQRQAIERVITASCEHLTAEQIYFLARQELPSLAMGTVYRNLNQMLEEKTLKKITMPGAADRFDRCVSPHSHLLCSRCGCVSDCCVDGLQEFLQQKTGLELLSYELTLYGLCQSCAKNEDSQTDIRK